MNPPRAGGEGLNFVRAKLCSRTIPISTRLPRSPSSSHHSLTPAPLMRWIRATPSPPYAYEASPETVSMFVTFHTQFSFFCEASPTMSSVQRTCKPRVTQSHHATVLSHTFHLKRRSSTTVNIPLHHGDVPTSHVRIRWQYYTSGRRLQRVQSM